MKLSKNFSFWIVGVICLVATILNAIANHVWVAAIMVFVTTAAFLIYLSYRKQDV